jgi:hypothetical protein
MQGYPRPMAEKASRLRQRLRQLEEQRQQELDSVCDERGPLIRGSFGKRRRVCGHPSCHCAHGERHVSSYLTATEEGKVRQVHVPAGDEQRVGAGSARYRRFLRARARLAEIATRQLELVDELCRSLLAPYPPDRPLPPASRFGRRPKND